MELSITSSDVPSQATSGMVRSGPENDSQHPAPAVDRLEMNVARVLSSLHFDSDKRGDDQGNLRVPDALAASTPESVSDSRFSDASRVADSEGQLQDPGLKAQPPEPLLSQRSFAVSAVSVRSIGQPEPAPAAPVLVAGAKRVNANVETIAEVSAMETNRPGRQYLPLLGERIPAADASGILPKCLAGEVMQRPRKKAENIRTPNPESHEIEIHIGRIEVTAVQTGAPVTQTAKPRRLALSLGDYLRRRNRRNS